LALFQGFKSSVSGSESPERVLLGPSVLLSIRPDFRHLPSHHGRGALLTHKAAEELQVLSKKMHTVLDKLTPKDQQEHRPIQAEMDHFLRTEVRGKKPEWLRP